MLSAPAGEDDAFEATAKQDTKTTNVRLPLYMAHQHCAILCNGFPVACLEIFIKFILICLYHIYAFKLP